MRSECSTRSVLCMDPIDFSTEALFVCVSCRHGDHDWCDNTINDGCVDILEFVELPPCHCPQCVRED